MSHSFAPPPPSAPSSEGGIQVEQAQKDFENLSRELSKVSAEHRSKTGEKDVESNSEDDFDLSAYLQSNASASAAMGIKRKLVGVTWANLTVFGKSSMDIRIETFKDAMLGSILFLPKALANLSGVVKPNTRKLLDGFTGCLKPGELCLVLARPGGGASTFLKAISNNRDGFVAVEGDVQYAGIGADEFRKRYQSEVVYNQEDDVHHYALTVKQTIDFALKLKTPGKLLPDQTKAEFVDTVRDALLRMFNIHDTKDTVVGNEVLRGISGGQKKRVSIAEMMCTRAAVLAFDNSSRGLDASTALDFAKAMRLLTNVNHTATFISLYQAGEGIYNQFDKVLLIDQGKCAYFGPAQEARQYMINLGFLDLPRQTSGDWLCGITDPNLAPESRFQPGRDASNVPSTPEALAEAYLQSDVRRRMIEELEGHKAQLLNEKSIEEEFRAAVKQDKNRGVGKKSVYTVSFFRQVQILFLRNLQITLGHSFDLTFSYQSTIVLSLILGSTYINLPETALGAFSRGGLLFISCLFNALVAFSELPTTMTGRPILFKHKSFAFFRPSAFVLGQTLAEIPFTAPRLFLFSVITFFMTDLHRTVEGFFTFYINVYVVFLAMVALFKFFGSITSDKQVAARIGAVLIVVIAVFSGYFIPKDDMPRWLFWISYLNPLYYAFGALIINEFKDLNLRCEGDYVIPRNLNGNLPQYSNSVDAFSVCSLRGAVPGAQSVNGMDYLRANFGYDKVSDQWLYFGVIVIFFLGFTAINMLIIELFTSGSFSSSLSIIKKPNAEEARLNQALKERRLEQSPEQDQANLNLNACSYTWKVSYTVPVKGGEKRLLDDVQGYCLPGTLTALMGSSGAGKTTLLDVLSDRKSIGVISGDRLVNGRTFGKEFQRGCGYAEQMDVHEGTATLREALRFSAYLRQPASVPKEEKDAWVEEIISLLELEDLADAMIGTPDFGLGVGDRKRATIGVELAAKPDLLLFLDEPTSGLDGQTAYNVVRFLKKLANAGQAILCTIHQPSSLLLENFQNLLLLERGGKTVYFGPIGKDSKHLTDYFSKYGAHCPSDVNPAEYMLEAIGAGSSKCVGDKPWSQVYRESELFQENARQIEKINSEALARPVDDNVSKQEYATSYFFQLKTVLKRTNLASWRNASYQYTRVFFHAAIALIVSLLYLQLDDSASSVQYRVFGIFGGVILPAIIIQQIEPFYINARSIFIREDSSRMFYPSVFSLSLLISELPYAFLCAVIYFLLFYFPIGFSYDSGRASYFFAMMCVSEFFSVSFGAAISALSPSVYIANLATPFFIAIFNLFAGVTIPKNVIPGVWRTWLYYANPYTHYVSGLLANELYDLKINCKPQELSIFQSPPGQTCREYAGAFIQAGPGYLGNPNATSDCQYCQFDYGQDYYEPLGVAWNHRAREIGILLAMCGSNIIIMLISSKYLKYAKR